jgi:hypothetical protein
MQKLNLYKILLVLSLFVIQKAQSQTCGLTLKTMTPPQYFQETKSKNTIDNVGLYRFKNTTIFNYQDSFYLNQYTKYKATPSVFAPVSFAFSVNNLPFFCKLEYKMGVEKQYPLKIRLGDVQYVDQLEGKNKNGNLH